MTPRETADERVKEAQYYVKLGERLNEIHRAKMKAWAELRKSCKSIVETDRMWEMTELGLEEKEIKIKMKCKAIKISSLKTQIEVMNLEARNQY